MKFVSTIVSAAGLLSAAVNAAPSIPVESQLPGSWTTRPNDDPFYNVPDDVADYPLGHIFKSRTTQNNPGILNLQIPLESTRQFVYRSSNSSGAPTSTVATLLLPKNYDPKKLLVYNVAEDANDLDCSVSYAIQADTNLLGTGNQAVELVPIIFALDRGWPVLVPDYEGPNSAYIAGILAGHMVLDAIRALMDNQDYAGINMKEANIALWGYSGGSLASAWAGELQPSYYPELNIAGIAMGGLVPNVSSIVKYDTKPLTYGIVSLGILGLASEYPELQALLDEELIPEKKSKFYSLRETCLPWDSTREILTNWASYFKDGTDVLNNPVVQKVMQENTQGKYVPKAPFYIYHSIWDEVAPFPEANAWYDHYCDLDVNIEFHVEVIYPLEHILTGVIGIPEAIIWLDDRLNGKDVKTGCHRKINWVPLNLNDVFKGLGPDLLNFVTKIVLHLGWK